MGVLASLGFFCPQMFSLACCLGQTNSTLMGSVQHFVAGGSVLLALTVPYKHPGEAAEGAGCDVHGLPRSLSYDSRWGIRI